MGWRNGDYYHEEGPKCGARGGCEKHGVSKSGIDLTRRNKAYADLHRSAA